MSGLVLQFVDLLSRAFAAGRSSHILASLPLDETHPFFAPLYQALSTIPDAAITTQAVAAQIASVANDTRDIFSGFVLAVLRNVKGASSASTSQEGYSQAYSRFESLVNVYTEANKLYGQQSNTGSHLHAFLNPLVVSLAHTLVQRAAEAAAATFLPLRHARSARSIRDTCRQIIERSNQIAMVNVTDSEWQDIAAAQHAVGDNMWPLSNILWRIYAERKLHTQSTELQKAISSLMPREDKRLAARGRVVAQGDVCQSYYWRGKLGVVLLDMRNARYWLDKALTFCPATNWQQRRAILIRMIPINLLLGRLPSEQLLRSYGLDTTFGPLLRSYRTGNIPLWRKTLRNEREWFRRRSIWLILYERGEILVWRNLLRNSLKQYYLLNPAAPKGRCPTAVFVASAQSAFRASGEAEDGTIGLVDLICVIASLIDQSFILGHLSYSQQYLVMRPSPDGMGGFPRMSQVVPRRVEAIT